jgi:hypothetical protein
LKPLKTLVAGLDSVFRGETIEVIATSNGDSWPNLSDQICSDLEGPLTGRPGFPSDVEGPDSAGHQDRDCHKVKEVSADRSRAGFTPAVDG